MLLYMDEGLLEATQGVSQLGVYLDGSRRKSTTESAPVVTQIAAFFSFFFFFFLLLPVSWLSGTFSSFNNSECSRGRIWG